MKSLVIRIPFRIPPPHLHPMEREQIIPEGGEKFVKTLEAGSSATCRRLYQILKVLNEWIWQYIYLFMYMFIYLFDCFLGVFLRCAD